MAKDGDDASAPGPRYVKVDELRTSDEGTGCLRPLGLCDLGGCCDICWYGQSATERDAPPSETPPADDSC